MRSGLSETISFAEVMSHTEQEYPSPIESQCCGRGRGHGQRAGLGEGGEGVCKAG